MVVKLAFVGCGAVSLLHLKGVLSHSDKIIVTACVDPSKENAANIGKLVGPHTLIFSSLTEAIEANNKHTHESTHGERLFDAVDIMVPHNLHKGLAIESFRAALHVLLEKPMAINLEECKEIMEEAKKSGKVFMIAENAQYWAEINLTKKLILEGAIGDVISARTVYIDRKQSRITVGDTTRIGDLGWRKNSSASGGGIAMDGGSHFIRPLRMWLGEIEEVVAVTAKPISHMEGESLVKAIFKFPNGVVATFDAIMADTVLAPDPRWRIVGTKGEILIEDVGIKLFDRENLTGKQILCESGGYIASFAAELEDFANTVNNGTPPAATAEYSLGELRTALAIYKSAKEGCWIKVWN